jgi:hypothetical protein
MHIAVTNNNGTRYLRVEEDYSVVRGGRRVRRKRVVKNLGPLSRFDDGMPDYLGRLRESFRAGAPLIGALAELPVAAPVPGVARIAFDRSSDADCFADPKNIGCFVLDALFGELGVRDVLTKLKSAERIASDLVGIARLLVFGRVLEPGSKLATFEGRGGYLEPVTSCDDVNEVYAALGWLDAASGAIQRRMGTKVRQAMGRKGPVCYYDVTNYWFEIKGKDPDETDGAGNVIAEGMRKPGPSKARNRKPIVQMGLFTDENTIPISFHLSPGNHIDQTTLRPAMRATVDKMGFERVVVVADGGLNSGKNIAHILGNGGGYILSKSAKGSDKATKAWMLDEKGYEANGHGTFKSKSMIRERTIEAEDGTRRKITEKVVCYWSYAHWLRAMRENESFLAWVDTVREHPDKLKDRQSNYQKYLKRTRADKDTGEVLKNAVDVLSLNWAKIEQDQALMGYYTIMTSEVDMADADVISRYHGLGRIEDAFRTIKTDLEGRPVFVRTPEHINAHFLVCFIALSMIRIIQHRIQVHQGKDPAAVRDWEFGLTSERVKEALAGFTADPLPQGYYRLGKPTDDLKLLADALGFKADLRLPTLADLGRLRRSIASKGIMCP